MKVAVTGGTGLLGTSLLQALFGAGHSVQLLTRSPERHATKLPRGSRATRFDALSAEPPELEAGVEAVVHLAGEPVAERWTEAHKQRIRRSRVEGTRALVEGVRRAGTVRTLVSASAVGIYGNRESEPLTEQSPPGDDFLAQVCQGWEQEARAAEETGVRVVCLRIGIVLDRSGGALSRMLTPFRFGLGGRLGSGKQYMSWIHPEDVVGLALHALAREDLRGPVNATAPHPVTNREFTRTLAQVLGRPAALAVPAVALRLALGEMAQVALTGQRVVPQAALSHGYDFRYPLLEPALREVLEVARAA